MKAFESKFIFKKYLPLQSTEKRMFGFLGILSDVFVVEIQGNMFYFETKFLIQKQGWIVNRHV